MIDLERFNIYEVGGCVRDRLLGREPKDIDYGCVYLGDEGDTIAVLRLLEEDLRKAGVEVFKTTEHFYVIRGKTPDGEAADFVLARKDGPYTDGRRPDFVLPGTLEDDLARRDFTVNAMARTVDPAGASVLFDPFGGKKDLEVHALRCVGDPYERFREDALRVLRAIRFSIVLDMNVTAETYDAMTHPETIQRVCEVSKDRRREELEKAFRVDTIRTMEYLEHTITSELKEAVMGGIMLRPTFTFKGLHSKEEEE